MGLKRIFSFVLLSMLFGLGAIAEPVTEAGAKKLAERFLELNYSGGELSINEVIAYNLENNKTGYYFVKFSPVGWVMVAGDDLLTPVIGYSFKNALVPREQWGESALRWMKSLDDHIVNSLKRDDLKRNSEWDEIYKESYTKAAQGIIVDPFIEVTWGQGSGWNRFCPEDEAGPGGHALVGCVAVSMAQAMSVYQYPVQPVGAHGYDSENYGYLYVDYDAQAPYDWASMSNTSSGDENARLLYHLAVGVNMQFSATASGAYTNIASGVLKAYFGYAQSTVFKNRAGYADAEWHQIIVDELVQGRPVIYKGNDENGNNGHAFNVDGVDVNGLFHLNWGWSGSYNGYFTLNALTPGSSDFSINGGAIFGIRPPESGPYDITLSNSSVYDQQAMGCFVGKVEVADENDENEYTYELKGAYNIVLREYGPAVFYIENDSLKTNEMFDSEASATEYVYITVSDLEGKTVSKEFNISIEKFYYGPTAMTLTNNKLEEGKNSGYFVGLVQVDDDIENNVYEYNLKGGYNAEMLSADDFFIVRNDSLFSNQIFDMDDGIMYYLSIQLSDDFDHSITEVLEINIIDNISGGTDVKHLLSGELKIYPNPALDYVIVEFSEVLSGDITVDIFNMLGQKCLHCALSSGESLDISTLDNGTYMLVAKSGKEIVRKKLLIAR